MTDHESRPSVPESQGPDWLADALARRDEFEADKAAFTAAVKQNADKIAAQISALLPDGYSLGYDTAPLVPVTIQTVNDLLGQLPRPRRVTLHCHADVLDALKDHAETAGADRAQLADRLCGIDVRAEGDLGPGEWQFRENGEVINTGKIRTIEEWAQEVMAKIRNGEFAHG